MKTLTFVLLLVSAGAFAQKCKFNIDKKDPFTNEQVNTLVHDKNGFVWVTVKRGGKFSLEMGFRSVESTAVFKATDTMKVKLADGTILKLRPKTDAEPMGSSVSTTTTTGSQTRYYSISSVRGTSSTTTMATSLYNPIFDIDQSVYEAFARSLVVAIRFEYGPKPWDLDFTRKPLSKAANEIQDHAKCILSLN